MSLIDEPSEGMNVPEYSVSEISGAVKRVIESGFGHVRVRGELGRVTKHRSGHCYLDLKDDRAVLSGVIWRNSVAGLSCQPEEGMEVVATGRLTTFPGQSKYQIVIDDIAPAGVGALMAMLEKRRKALAAEGLFDEVRKKPLPYLPRVIGVVTSPSGAVIRDILHRLSERFPVHVLVWPCAMQGKECAPQVAAAIRGFCRMPPSVAPRPDVLIVARGGGSVEDLWGFNEEVVVRAVADCPIPVISAVGHETDTTLIDHAADRRAPTPTAAAEMAVPVRRELVTVVSGLEARRLRALETVLKRWRQRLTDLSRALPRPDAILAERRQRLDLAVARLARPDRLLEQRRAALGLLAGRLAPALRRPLGDARVRLTRVAGRLAPERLRDRLDRLAERLSARADRLRPAEARLRRDRTDRLAGLARTLRSLGPRETLARGFAIVRDGEGRVLPRAAGIGPGTPLEVQFDDGRLPAIAGRTSVTTQAETHATSRPEPRGKDDKQGSLF